ncbi:DUF2948 family protein [Actibacterium sp. D379-3]
MSEDARFEDGGAQPLSLKALEAADLEVISSLVQDAVFPVTEMAWRPRERRFALLLNRFRWEDRVDAERRGRPYERVQSVLAFDDVAGVASQGVDRGETDMILSLLSVAFEPGEDGTGRVVLTLAGDGAIALDVECLDVTLKDVTRPYLAPSRKVPVHE